MLKSLELEYEEVIPFGPIKAPVIEFCLKIFQFFIQLLFGKRYHRSHSVLLSKAYAFILKRKLHNIKIDAIFAPTASSLIAYLDTDVPIFYYSDATSNLLIDYYFFNLSKLSKKELIQLESNALNKSKISIFASQWAAADATKTYHIDPNKVKVIKMGANINLPLPELDFAKKLEGNTYNILFVGIDWQRKGGDIVLKTLDILTEKGLSVQLTVCGCVPPETRKYMTVYPYLNKNLEADFNIFSQLLNNAHLFFLPTQAECAGIVFCEAAAYGIPIIATDTGGVSSYVKNKETGYLLPVDAKAEDYARLIMTLFNDKNQYLKMATQSHKLYESELNWQVWREKIKEIM